MEGRNKKKKTDGRRVGGRKFKYPSDEYFWFVSLPPAPAGARTLLFLRRQNLRFQNRPILLDREKTN